MGRSRFFCVSDSEVRASQRFRPYELPVARIDGADNRYHHIGFARYVLIQMQLTNRLIARILKQTAGALAISLGEASGAFLGEREVAVIDTVFTPGCIRRVLTAVLFPIDFGVLT